ncbi:MAG: maleylpyruvate isomerase N-terminal domain-containing protein [Candidatus Promineofilum sp.]|nr:maleylpyruvate isomerase N-terminal domain-containing protein [Promineifilum sp.]MCW5864246.1 maleylpyruvate isomerase N-terminal domain-containing protein [Anaerolineae bacterium]
MHAADVLKYGNLTVLRGLQGLPVEDWTTAGVCGWWSVREIIAHLASFEVMLLDVLAIAAGETNDLGPTLRAWASNGQRFNDEQVAARAALSPEATLADYAAAQAAVMARVAALPAGATTRAGFLPAYGREYDLDDFLTYSFYGHKREHTAQIAVFRDAIKR